MSSLGRFCAPAMSGLCLVFLATFIPACGGDSPTEPGNGESPASNMALDRLGVALVPGASTTITVTALEGSLKPFTVKSSAEGVATVSGSMGAIANAVNSAAGTIVVTGVSFGRATVSITTESGDRREFPVTVYDPMVIDTGELLIRFTDQFGGRFADSGSGADHDGDFFQPIAPAGYYPLGAIGFAGYRDPNNLMSAVIVVKDKGTNTANPPLKAPVDYELIWHNGVWMTWPGFHYWVPDGNYTGSFWRPVPPEGYVAMGVVVHNWEAGADYDANNPANQKPPLDAVMCVREDLTVAAKIGSYVWDDGGNGLKDRWFWSYQLIVPDSYSDYEQMHLAPGTFVGQSNLVGNNSNLVANVLKIAPQILIDADYRSTLWRPMLTSMEDPGNSTQPLKTRTILVPFTAFADVGRDINWKVANSPFYRLERTFYWDEECFASGDADCYISYTTGSTICEEKTFWKQESVEASREAGFQLKGFGGKLRSTVTKTLGFAESRGVSEFEEKTVSTSVPAPGEGAIAAAWKAANRFRLYRHHGLVVEEVVSPWTMYEDAFHSDKFP